MEEEKHDDLIESVLADQEMVASLKANGEKGEDIDHMI